MEEIRNAYKILVGKLKGRVHLEDLGVNWGIILEWERVDRMRLT